MKREIKFRGLHQIGQKKIWVYGCLAWEGWENRSFYITTTGTSYLVDTESIGQFTGLKDKNDKEIYEGDQLYVCAGYSSKVIFKDGMFMSEYTHPEDGEILPLVDVIGKDTVIIE